MKESIGEEWGVDGDVGEEGEDVLLGVLLVFEGER